MNKKRQQSPAASQISSAIVCTGDWRITSWNKKAEVQFGYTKDEVIDKPIIDFILTPFSNLEIKTSLSELIFASKQHDLNNVKLYGIATDKEYNSFPVEMIATETPNKDSYTITIYDLLHRENDTQKQSRECEHQQIINDIFKISLEPYLLKEELEQILDYLLALEKYNFHAKAGIFLIEQDPNLLNLVASRGFSKSQIKTCGKVAKSQCVCGKAAQTGETQFYDDQETQEKPQSTCSSPHYSIPIKKGKEVIGVLCMYLKKGGKHSQATANLLQDITDILAGIIENQKMDLQLINLVNDLRVSIVDLREEKKYSDSIIQGLNHGLIVTDLGGAIQKSNMVAQNILSPFGDSILHKTLPELIGDEAAKQILNHRKNNINPSDQELILSTDLDEEIVLNFSTVPREDSKGDEVGLIISFTDISEIKYARREMEKMNRLSTVAEIASAVAHEVRNPLAGIKIMAQSIEEDSSSTDEQYECATRITRQVDRLNELLSEFFSYARPVIPKKRITSLIDIFSETEPLIHNKLEKNSIELEESYPEDLPPIIADPNQVQQVFLNLMLNAIDAIKQHGTISIVAEELTKSKLSAAKKKLPILLSGAKYLQVTFSDNGTGMPPDIAEKVFEPFFTTKTTGSGLGMSIVYRTLKENDAAITLKSAEGKGTTFTIYFLTP